MSNIDPMRPQDDPLIQRALKTLARDMAKHAARNQPYYSEKAALLAKDIIDRLHRESAPLKIIPGGVFGQSINTCKLMYYQGLRYLRDHLDPDDHYKLLCAATRCTVYRDYLELHIKRQVARVIPLDTWRDPLIEFIENSKPGEKFIRQDIALAGSDKEWIEGKLNEVKELFLWKVEDDSILVIRYDNRGTQQETSLQNPENPEGTTTPLQ